MHPMATYLQRSQVYQKLSQNPEIVEVCQPSSLLEIPEVQIDQYAITDGAPLGTLNVTSCFATCTQGRRRDGRVVLGLAHSCLNPLDLVQKLLQNQLLKAGCTRASIKTYVVGGLLSAPNASPGTATYSPRLERDILRSQYRVPARIVGARFNVIDTKDEELSVVFTPNQVLISKKALFRPTENIGIDFPDEPPE